MPERIRVGVNLSVRAIAREIVERGEGLARPLAQWLSACFSFHCASLARKGERRARDLLLTRQVSLGELLTRLALKDLPVTRQISDDRRSRGVRSDCRSRGSLECLPNGRPRERRKLPTILLLAAGWTPRRNIEASPWGSTLLAVRARELNRLQKLKSSVRPFDARGDESRVIRKV